MKAKLSLLAAVVAGTLGLAAGANSQTTAPPAADAKSVAKPETKGAPEEAAKSAEPKVYHGGGKHDQKGHEAAVKAKATGKKMEEPAVHAGGRHDEQAHKAAIKAQQGTSKPADTPAKK